MSVKFNKNFLDKNLYTKKISIDSHDRDRNYIPSYQTTDSSNDYKISLEKFDELKKNVVGISLVSASIPNTEYIINDNNNKLDVLFGNVETTIQLTNNNYTLTEFAKELTTKFHDVSTSFEFTKNLIDDSKVDITHTTSEFTLLLESGPNAKCSFQDILGLDYTDIESTAMTITTGIVNLISNRYVDIVIEEIPRIGLMNTTKEEENYILDRVYLDNDYGKYKVYHVNDYDRIYNFFNGIELSNLSIKLLNDKNKIYNSNNYDNVITLEFILLKDNTPNNLYINPSSTDTLLLKYFKAFLIDKKHSDQKMKDYMSSVNQNNKQLLNAFTKNLDNKKFNNDDIINIVNVIKQNNKVTNNDEFENNYEFENNELTNKDDSIKEGFLNKKSMSNHIQEDALNNINNDLIDVDNDMSNNSLFNNILNQNINFIYIIIFLIVLLFLFNLFKRK